MRDKGTKKEDVLWAIQHSSLITDEFKEVAGQVVDIIFDKLGKVDPSDIAVQSYGMCLKVVSSYKEA